MGQDSLAGQYACRITNIQYYCVSQNHSQNYIMDSFVEIEKLLTRSVNI